MPREEAKQISERVRQAAYQIEDPNVLEIISCGSYRRGKANCQDVDILMTRRDEKSTSGFLRALVARYTHIYIIIYIYLYIYIYIL